jgi:hypothetical protein
MHNQDPYYHCLAARSNLLSLWRRFADPEQLSNSPSHLRGQHAGTIIGWQLRRNMCDYCTSDTFGRLAAL